MLGNDRQQVTQQFSFIESLDFSQKSRKASPDLKEDCSDRASSSQQQQDGDGASAIIAADHKTSTIGANSYQSDSDAYRSKVADSNSTSGRSTETDPAKGYLGKILFALACSYCLFVLWWLFGHQGIKVLTMFTGGKQVVLSKSEVQFIDYMERSLNKIEDQIAAKETESDDVVYVPVYTPTATPQIPPALPNNTPVVQQPIPPSLKIPAPPPLPTPTPLADNPGNEKNEIVTAIEPTISRSLIGVLELGGDKSAALVKVKGKTRRVWLGEEISDGWILESVGNQKANISYQGQVRSVSVGETF